MSKTFIHNSFKKYKSLLDNIIDRDDVVLIMDENDSFYYISSKALLFLKIEPSKTNFRLNKEELKAFLPNEFDLNISHFELENTQYQLIKITSDFNYDLYKSVADQSRDAIIITNTSLDSSELIIEYANEAYLKLTGYSMDEIIGKNPNIMQGPKTDQTVLSRLKENLLNNQPFFGQTYNYRKDGSEFMNEWAINPIKSTHGEVLKYVAIIRDVTEREEQKSILIQSQLKLKSIVESSERCLLMYDKELTVKSFNTKLAERLFLDFKIRVKEGDNLKTIFNAGQVHFIDTYTQKASRGRTVNFNGLNFLFEDDQYYDYSFNPINGQEGIEGYILTFRNVDNEKRASLTIEQNEAKYRTMIDALAEGVILQNRDGKIIDYNESALNILGLTSEQLLGRNSYDPRWKPVNELGEDFPGYEHPISKSLNEGASIDGYVMGIHKPNGSLTWLSVNSRPIKNENNKIVQALASVYDITEEYKLRKEAEGSSLRFQALFQNNPLPMVLIDMSDNNHIHDANDAFLKNYGYSKEELLSVGINDFEESEHGVVTKYQEAVKSANSKGSNYNVHHTKSGSSLIVEEFSQDLEFADGSYRLYLFDDKTEEVLHKYDLEKSEERYKHLFDKNPNSLFLINLKDGLIRRFNEQAEATYKYSKSEFLEMSFLDLFAKKSHIKVNKTEDLCDLDSTEDYVHNDKIGSLIDVNLYVNHLSDAGEEALLIQVNDVTKQKRAENKLRHTEHQLASLVKNNPVSVWSTDISGKVVFCLGSLFDKLNLDLDSFVGQKLNSKSSIVHINKKEFQNALGGEEVNVISTIADQYINSTLFSFKDSTNKSIGIIGVSTDITNLIHTQNQRKETSNILAMTQQIGKVGGWRMILDNSELIWSDVTRQIHELPQDYKPDAKTAINFYHELDKEVITNAVENLINNGEEYDLELRIILENKKIKWVRTQGKRTLENKKVTEIFGTFQDITESKVSRLKEEEFAKIYALSGELACVATMDGFFEYVNPAWEKVLGYTMKYLTSKPFKYFVHQDDIVKTERIFEKLISGEISEVTNFKNRYRTKNGRYKWLSWSANVDLNLGKVYCVAIDITEQVNLENELLKKEKFFRKLVSKGFGSSIVINKRGVITYAGGNNQNLFGYNADSIYGQPLLNYVHKEDKPKLKEDLELVLKIAEHNVQDQIRLVENGGGIKWAEININNQLTDDDVNGLVINLIDITETVQAHSRTVESEVRYRNLVNNSPMPIIIMSGEAILFLNYAASKSLGEDFTDFINKPISKYLVGKSKMMVLDEVNKFQKGQLVKSNLIDLVLQRNANENIYVEALMAPTEYNGKSAIQLMYLDITEKKNLLNEQLKLRGIITDSFDEVYIFDSKSLKFTYANRSALQNTGYTLEEMLKLTPFNLRPETRTSAELNLLFKEAKESKNTLEFTGLNKRKDGTLYRVTVRMQFMKLVDDEFYVATVNDVTEKYKLKQRKDIVNNVNEAIVKRDASKEVLADLITMIASELKFDFGEIWRIEDDNYIRQAYVGKVSTDLKQLVDLNKDIEFKIGEGLIGKCFKDKEVIWAHSFTKDNMKLHKLHINMAIKTVVYFPLIVDDESIGVGKLYSINTLAFDEDTKQLLLTLGGQLAQFKRRKNTEAALINSLNEKEALLQEIHHRVKNNLQTVSSLLYLKSSSIDDPEVKRFFIESQSRIAAITFTHEKLLRAKSYKELDIKMYLDDLIENIYLTNFTSERKITLTKKIESHILPTDTVMNCGLIINELLANAFDHAFEAHEDGTIIISLKQIKQELVLTVHDSGIGFNYENIYEDSVGVQLVHLFVQQLKGKMTVSNSNGTKIQIKFRYGKI